MCAVYSTVVPLSKMFLSFPFPFFAFASLADCTASPSEPRPSGYVALILSFRCAVFQPILSRCAVKSRAVALINFTTFSSLSVPMVVANVLWRHEQISRPSARLCLSLGPFSAIGASRPSAFFPDSRPRQTAGRRKESLPWFSACVFYPACTFTVCGFLAMPQTWQRRRKQGLWVVVVVGFQSCKVGINGWGR